MNLHRQVINLPDNELAGAFHNDRFKEGLVRTISTEQSIVFKIGGLGPFVELLEGVRFNSVNQMLVRASRIAGWDVSRSSQFELELCAIYFKKIGEFCGDHSDIPDLCPESSVTASSFEIADIITSRTSELSRVDLRCAFETSLTLGEYSWFEPYTIPAAAVLLGESCFLKRKRESLLALVEERKRESYAALLNVLYGMSAGEIDE